MSGYLGSPGASTTNLIRKNPTTGKEQGKKISRATSRPDLRGGSSKKLWKSISHASLPTVPSGGAHETLDRLKPKNWNMLSRGRRMQRQATESGDLLQLATHSPSEPLMNIEGWAKNGEVDPMVVKRQVCKELCYKPLWYLDENVTSFTFLADEQGQFAVIGKY